MASPAVARARDRMARADSRAARVMEMPRIIDYPEVLRQMQSRGFVSLYHNAGAFGFGSNEDVKTYGFIAEPDPTIRAEAHHFVRQTNELPEVLRRIASALASDPWLMPKSP